jgi:hypothetical protein
MLSYKYYKNPANRTITTNAPPPLITVNNIFRTEFKKAYTDTLYELANPIVAQHTRYDIWDILAENAVEIFDNTMISQFEKLYMAKIFASIRDGSGIQPGVEYYCLRRIIRLAAFRVRPNLKWVATIIGSRISKLQQKHKTKKQAVIFARNIRKIEIIKRAYNTRVILRAHWRNVYDCYNLGDQSVHELLNQTDILKHLNIAAENTITQGISTNCDITKELEKIDNILDEELEIDSDVDSVIGLDQQQPDEPLIDDPVLSGNADDYNIRPAAKDIDNISQPGSDMADPAIIDEIDEIAIDPDEWQ